VVFDGAVLRPVGEVRGNEGEKQIVKVKVVPSSLSEGWVIGADPDFSAIQPCGGQVQSNG